MGVKKLLLLLLLSLPCASSAQDGIFFPSERFSNSVITTICQDRVGYIWVGTEYGLNRFDGYHFTTYLHEQDDSTSLLNNIVTHILCDNEGRLWIGTSKGLQLYDYATDSFHNYRFTDGNMPRVSEIRQLRDGRLIAGTSGYGLYLVTPGNTNLTELKEYKCDERDTYFSCLYEDATGALWKSGANRFSRIAKDGHIESFSSTLGIPTRFIDIDGQTVAVCRDDFLVYDGSTLSSGIIDIAASNGKGTFRTAMKDRDGNIYIGTTGNGLFWIPAGTRRLQRHPATATAFDLNTARVWAISEDRQGNIWLGCQYRGLLMLPARQTRFSHWSLAAQNIDVGTFVSSLCQGDNGITWCVVQKKGVYGLDGHGRVVSNPTAPSDVEIIFRDQHRDYWLGTDHGLFAYDPLTGRAELKSDFACDKFCAMADNGRGKLAVSVYSEGILIYDRQTQTFTNYNMNDADDPERGRLCNNWANNIIADHDGRFWVTTSSGVSCFDPQTESFKPYGWSVLADDTFCYSLCETINGDIVIGTEQGLLTWKRATNTLIPTPDAEKLGQIIISSVLQDNSGDLWCSSSYGIWHYLARQNEWVSYISGAGLDGHEYVTSVGMHTTADRIFFPTANGLTTFTPQQVSSAIVVANAPQLTAFYIENTPVSTLTLSDSRQVTEKPVCQSHHFTVSWHEDSFQLHFSLLNYADAANTMLEYRLGDEDVWQRTQKGHNIIAFNHLPSGTYDLEVRAVESNVTTPASSYTIVITTPWYRTTLAYCAYALLAIAVIILLLWEYRERMDRRLDEYKMKFLINATHDIRSPLTLIMNPLKKLIADSERMKATAPEEMGEQLGQFQQQLTFIDSNANRILSLVNQILDVRKIDKHQMHLHCQETDMGEWLKVIVKIYEFPARERGINIHLKLQKKATPIMAWIDRKQFDKVVSNLLSNALKYTFDRGDIVVALSQGTDPQARANMKDHIELSVTDNGTGMRDDTMAHLFDRFFQGNNSKADHIEGTGIGLNLCKMIVDLHHGTITGKNRSDGVKGSVFTVRLPMGNLHFSPEEIEQDDKQPGAIKLAGKKQPNTTVRILVVDDDEEISRYIAYELGEYYHFVACRNGKDALKELLAPASGKPYDLIVSDVMMPEMDGFTLLRLIRSNANISHLPVVMLTSKSDIANRLEGLEKGADAYITKPFDVDELHITIDNLLATRQRLRGKYSGAQQPTSLIENIEVKGNNEQLMERIMSSINHNLSDSDYNVDKLCADAGISRAHLHRKMKELTGLSISEFIRNIRLEQSARLLREQKLNITQVAYTVGFSSLPHFSSVFRKHFGISPRDFIEQQNSDEKPKEQNSDEKSKEQDTNEKPKEQDSDEKPKEQNPNEKTTEE